MNYFEAIQKIVCFGEGYLPKEVATKTRKREIVFTRQVVFYFMKQFTKDSLAKIGSYYGKDHATVLHSCKAINNLIDTDKIVRHKIAEYDGLIKKRVDFEMNILTDNIEQLKERLLTNILANDFIDNGTIEVYNQLLVYLNANKNGDKEQAAPIIRTIQDLECDVILQVAQRKVIDLTAILNYNALLEADEIPAPT